MKPKDELQRKIDEKKQEMKDKKRRKERKHNIKRDSLESLFYN